jgi:hypothetical protein
MTDGENIGSLHGNNEPGNSNHQPTVAVPIDVEQVDNYYTYESSLSDVPFSSRFITEVTIGRCVDEDLQVPAVLPEGAVKLLGWSQVVPQDSYLLLMGTLIPCLKDVRLFVGEMDGAFTQGYKSVIIEFKRR